jgi:DNA modification methylase
MELAKTIPDDFLDLVVTSPPYADTLTYGKEIPIFRPDNYADWILPLFNETYRGMKDSGSFILNINDKIIGSERSIYVYDLVCRVVRETGFSLHDRYIWHKKSCMPSSGVRRLNDRVEYIFHFVKTKNKFKANTDDIREPYSEISLKRFKNTMHGHDTISADGSTKHGSSKLAKPHPKGTKPTTVFRFDLSNSIRGLKHPAPFHPQIPEKFITWLTDVGDVVLDPFMGSGTTAIVAHDLDREYIGFELNELYKKDAEERILSMAPKLTDFMK